MQNGRAELSVAILASRVEVAPRTALVPGVRVMAASEQLSSQEITDELGSAFDALAAEGPTPSLGALLFDEQEGED